MASWAADRSRWKRSCTRFASAAVTDGFAPSPRDGAADVPGPTGWPVDPGSGDPRPDSNADALAMGKAPLGDGSREDRIAPSPIPTAASTTNTIPAPMINRHGPADSRSGSHSSSGG
ncbi:hypothetical protein GCM10010404_77830 [Nonomuraea africana]